MIVAILAITAIVLAAFFYLTFFSKPKSLIKFYKAEFQSKGFKVYDYPFKASAYSELEYGMKAQEKSRDVMSYTKEVASQFDLTISNLIQRVQINLISPKLMQAFFQCDQDKLYEKDEFFVNGLRKVFGSGITLSTGNVWKHKRRVITKMLNFSYIAQLVPRIEGIIQRKAAETLAEMSMEDGQFHEFDLMELTTTIASTVVLELFFGGSKFNVNEMKIKDMKVNHFVRYLFDLILQQLLSPATIIFGDRLTKLKIRKIDKQLSENAALFHQFVKEFIEKRLEELDAAYQQKKEVPQVFTDLIEAFYCEEIIKNKQSVTPQFIQDLINDFGTLYAAGTDTTAHNSQVSLYYVMSHPEVYKKLKKQISRFKDISKLTYDDFKECPYLQATIMESLRMYSSANGIFPRVAKEDHYLKLDQTNSILIKKGTIVNPANIPIHYKSSVYSDPQQFRPERFLDAGNKIISPQPYTWMNFSAGPRSCVGKQLALTEIKTMLVTLFTLYDFRCDDSNKLLEFKQFAISLNNIKYQMRLIKREEKL